MFLIKNRNEIQKYAPVWVKSLIFLLLTVLIPFGLISYMFMFVNNRNSIIQSNKLFESYSLEVFSTAEKHLGTVFDIATLLEDSSSIRSHMKVATKYPSKVHKMVQIYDDLEMPYSFKNTFDNRAISAVTLFTGNNLEYYSLPTTIDLALQRCNEVNSIYENETIPTGRFVKIPDSSYAYWIKDYRNIYENQYYGKIIIEINPIPSNLTSNIEPGSSLYQYSLDLNRYKNTQYYIFDSNNIIAFSDDNTKVGHQIQEYLPNQILQEDNNSTSENGSLFMSKQDLRLFPQTLLVVVPKESVLTEASAIGPYSNLIYTLSMLIYLTFLIVCLRFFLAPLIHLHDYYLATHEYPLIVPTTKPGFKELQEIFEIIKERTDDIITLKQECADSRIRQKEAEIKSLQNQMDPHFLFNILDSIGWKAAESGSNDVSAIVSRLGEMLRSNLIFSNRQKIKLREELQYINNYLILQQIRKSDSFQFKISVDDEILDHYYIPNLTLQPIVENCITHGFKNKTDVGHIFIEIWEDMDSIICRITDDGCGFDSSGYFDRIPNTLNNQGSGNHIALHNIQNRLKMIYGPEYGLKIQSELGKGTTVIVSIPLDRNIQ